MKLALFGAGAPGKCGVSDYTERLAEALQKNGVEVNLPTRFAGFDPRPYDVVHIQYPALMYRKSLAPQWFALRHLCPVVLSLHEFVHAHWTRQWSLHGFRRADAVIFTAQEERHAAERFLRLPNSVSVIPIGSNIPVCRTDLAREEDTIVFFGLIRPGKGVEEFLRMAAELNTNPGKRAWKFKVVGAVPEGREDYCQACRAEALDRVEWILNAPAEEVSRHLRSARFAYLHYPDGASVRRGSLLAALEHGLTVLSNPTGPDSPEIGRLVVPCVGPQEAARWLASHGMGTAGSVIRPETDDAVQAFLAARAWPEIARKHLAVYTALSSVRANG